MLGVSSVCENNIILGVNVTFPKLLNSPTFLLRVSDRVLSRSFHSVTLGKLCLSWVNVQCMCSGCRSNTGFRLKCGLGCVIGLLANKGALGMP